LIDRSVVRGLEYYTSPVFEAEPLRAIKSPIVAAAESAGPLVVLALDRDEKAMANDQRLGRRFARRGDRRALSRRGRHERAAQSAFDLE
jgi:hypothetical protein